MTVGKWILRKVDTKDWRAGRVTGCKHYGHGGKCSENGKAALYEMRNVVGGRAAFLEQVRALEKTVLSC